MAEFNPDVQDTGPVQFNRIMSEGPGVDKSMGTLFSGIGDVLGSAVQSGDNFVQNTIQDAVRYSSDSVGTELGTNSQSYPTDIPASQALMGSLTAAKNQGKISDEYYWQRMSNTMKGLRARFPGYEKEVDQAFQQVTGQNPANAFRDMLFRNINLAGNALAQQQASDQKYIQENIKYLPPSMWDPNQVEGGINGQKAQIYQGKYQEYQAQHLDEMSKFNNNMASSNYNTRVNQIAGSAIDYINKSLGTNSASFTDIMQKFSQGGTITPENKSMLNQALDGAISNITQQMTLLAAQPGYNQLSLTELSTARDKALDGLNQLKTMVNNQQYDQAAQLAASLNFSNDQRTQAAIQQFPILGSVNAVTKLGGPAAGADLFNKWLLQNDNQQQMFDWSTKNFVGNLGAAAATGQMSMGDIAKSTINNPGVSDPKQRAQLVLGSLSAFRTFAAGDFGQNPQQVRDFVNKVYGEDVSDNGLWRAVSNPDKITLYTQMFDPGITQKVLNTGDPNLIQQYQNSAISYARSIPSILEGAGTTAQQIPFQDILQVKFNPGTSRLEVGVAPGRQGFQGALDNNYIGTTLKPAIADLNRVIGVMTPMWKAEGIDPQQGAQQLIQSFGGNLKDNQGGFFNWLSQQITGPADKSKDAKDDVVPNQISTPSDEQTQGMEINQNALAANLPSEENLRQMRTTGDISGQGGSDALLTLIGRAEGTDRTAGYDTTFGNGILTGGDVDLTKMNVEDVRNLQKQMLSNPNNKWNTSAVGRYQVVGSTLQRLIDKHIVSPTDKFDEATQDRIARYLISEAGLEDWQNGRMSDAEFSRNLSKQWASLANTSGKTYYPGQPRVGATAADVLGAAGSTQKDPTGQDIPPGYHWENGTILADDPAQ